MGEYYAETCYKSCSEWSGTFITATHFTLQPLLCCLWCIARVFIKASPNRNRINVGVLNDITKEVTTSANTTYTCANCLIAFLKQFKEQYGDKPIAIGLDNVRYQHCFLVTAFAKSIGIHLLFLPLIHPILISQNGLEFYKKKYRMHSIMIDPKSSISQSIPSFKTSIKTIIPNCKITNS